MAQYKISGLTAYPNSTFGATDKFEISYLTGGIHYSRYLTGAQLLASIPSGLTVGTTPITSGTIGRILFQNGSNLLAQDSALFWDNTNKRLGVGATPATTVRLDVRAQGALSTDIAFRVRNSADSANLFEFSGDGTFRIGGTTSTQNGFSYLTDGRLFMAKSGSNFIELNPSAANRLYSTNGWELEAVGTGKYLTFAANGAVRMRMIDGTIQIGSFNTSDNATNTMYFLNGTAPNTNHTDIFKIYSADIVAGNAAPHFRTENGSIIKLFKGAALTAADATLATAITRIAELEARLQANGLLA